MAQEPLTFKVAPHIVEDLGLNLYTDLARVLVEFVANAYDADSPCVRITLDKPAIDRARRVLKAEYGVDVEKGGVSGEQVEPLETRPLGPGFEIVIEDRGHGMSRDDLNRKFLVAGRRRRKEEPYAEGRSPGGRLLMGRKGIGKLAGFGVAKRIEVVSRKTGEAHATRIVLEYDEIAKARDANEIEVDEERLEDGGGLEPSGTRIVLSGLMYGPLKSRTQTMENALSDHFAFIEPEEFRIEMNGRPIGPPSITYAFAWPEPKRTTTALVDTALAREGGGEIRFSYRLRFTEEGQALPAAKRGVRVYSNGRLASAPSLLNADTNMHGFRMTDYLDGVVLADFIDRESADYIATDRQSLRWESPLLSVLYEYLSAEIKKACAACQKKRDRVTPSIVRNDQFTQTEIKKCALSSRDETMALRIAVVLKNGCKRGVQDPAYQSKLPALIRSIGHGNILAAISALADEEHPDLHRVAVEVARLTADEFDQFVSYAKARLMGILALQKIVHEADFRSKQNEAEIQSLFEQNPWVIDPTYTQFLSADERFDQLLPRLARELEIGSYAPGGASETKERPDLVFLLGNRSLDRLVVVELKSANLPLQAEHLDQLEAYMENSEDWLNDHGRPGVRIHGHLIGTLGPQKSRAKGVEALRRRMRKAGPNTDWRVRDYVEVLTDTESAHREIVEAYREHDEGDNDEAGPTAEGA